MSGATKASRESPVSVTHSQPVRQPSMPATARGDRGPRNGSPRLMIARGGLSSTHRANRGEIRCEQTAELGFVR